ncbi:MAG TPA: hypothetical protein VMT34_08720 [Aggregatilineales bacterium]|nr:hypothetical protein [Aggregatilineales bacterium]
MGKKLRTLLTRLTAMLFGLLLALLIIEVGLRLAYHSLSPRLQTALRDVRVSPFSDDRLAPPPLWRDDTRYLTIVTPGAQNSLQAGSPDVLFHVTSYSWWNGRVGFRSPPPTDGTLDAVALGDSFTFCFTELEDCWVTRVAAQTGIKIANLGQPVTGSMGHARIYQDFVSSITALKQPKLVLWEFYGNDFNDDYGLARLEGTNKIPPPADPSGQVPDTGFKLWLRQHSILYTLIGTMRRGVDPGVEMFVDPYRVQANGIDIAFGQSYIRDAFNMAEPRNQEGEQLSYAAILATKATVEANGGKFIILLMPTKEEVYRPVTEPQMGKAAIDAIAEPRLRLITFCKAQTIICLDLFSALQAHSSSQIYFPTDPHLTSEGNRVAAEAIVQFLRDQGIAM